MEGGKRQPLTKLYAYGLPDLLLVVKQPLGYLGSVLAHGDTPQQDMFHVTTYPEQMPQAHVERVVRLLAGRHITTIQVIQGGERSFRRQPQEDGERLHAFEQLR